MSKPILQLQEVSACYGQETVLDEINLDLLAGEVAALVSIDTSGGLTTLLKIAAGLKRPTSGRVLFDGQDVYKMGYVADQKMRSRIGVVLEGGALHPNQSVWDNVAFPLRYHGERRGADLTKTVERLLGDCGFSEDPKLFPWQISARGRKLAALARALSRDPELVIIDRFFEGLEMPDWRRLFELVMELNHHQGVSWLLISEVDAAIFQVAERVGVLQSAELIGYDHRRRLYEVPEIREAFEDAEAKPMRTRTQRAKALEPVSSQEVSLDISSSPLGEDSAFEADLTINIDGRMPKMKLAAGENPLEAERIGDMAATYLLDPKARPRPARSLGKLSAEAAAGLSKIVPSQRKPKDKAPDPALEDTDDSLVSEGEGQGKKPRKPSTLQSTIYEPPPPGTVDERIPGPGGPVPPALAETFFEPGDLDASGAPKRGPVGLADTFYESAEFAPLGRGLRDPIPSPPESKEEPAYTQPATPPPDKSLEDTDDGTSVAGTPAPSLSDPAEAAKAKRKAAKRTVQAPAPSLSDPAEAAKAKRKAAKKTVQAPAPSLSDPAEAAKAKRKAAKRTVQAPAPALSDPAEAAKAKRKAAKKTRQAEAPAPALSDPAEAAKAKRKAAKKTRQAEAPAPALSDPAEAAKAAQEAAAAAKAKRKAAKKTVQGAAPSLVDPDAAAKARAAAKAKRRAAKKTVEAPAPTAEELGDEPNQSPGPAPDSEREGA